MADSQRIKVSFIGSKLASAKAIFVSLLAQVEATVVDAIKSGAIQVVDYALYCVRALAADTSVELYQASDSKEVGITNINDRKLDVNNYLLITGIQLLEAVKSATGTTKQVFSKDDLKSADYGQISAVVANGELEIKMNDKVILPRISCEVFRRGSKTYGDSALVGFMPWECPKMVQPLTEIVPTLWLPMSTETIGASSSDTSATKAVKLVLHGIKTNKN